MRDVVGIGENVLGEAAVTRGAAKLRLRTNGLPSRETVFTVPTRRVEPRHADPIAFLHVLNILADRDGDPDTFVTRNERQRGFERPIAARFGLDENLIASGFLNASTTAACTVFCMCEPFLHSCEPLTRQRRQGRGRLRSSSRVRPTRRRRPSRNSDCRTADSRRPRSLCPGRV